MCISIHWLQTCTVLLPAVTTGACSAADIGYSCFCSLHDDEKLWQLFSRESDGKAKELVGG